MNLRAIICLVILLFCAAVVSAQSSPAGSDQRSLLQQILTQTYQPSDVGKKIMGLGTNTDIRRAGTVVVIQQPGLYAALNRNEIASNSIHGLDTTVYRGDKDYPVPAGERFYIFSISVGEDTVTMGLLTGRAIPVAHGAGRLWMVMTFNFPAATLANADKDAVFHAIDPWIMPEGRSPSSAPPSYAAAPPSYAPAPANSPAPAYAPNGQPASAPPSAPAPSAAQQPAAPAQNLTPGMSRDQIVSALGNPQREVTFGTKTLLTYPGMVLVLEDGKLASVDQSGQLSARVAVHSDPTGAEIYLDGQLVGSTPSTVDVPGGNHTISVRQDGYQDWQRNLRVLSGSEINLNAKLEKK